MKKKMALFAIATAALLQALPVNAAGDPSAYYDEAPVHVTAPLSDMVFVGGYSAADFVQIPEVTISEEERDLLAALVWAEAGNQDAYGKQLVAEVVFNRIDDSRFPSNVTDVIFQAGQFTTAERLYSVSPNVTDACYEAVDAAVAHRTNKEVLFFNNSPAVYGQFLFRHQDHFFAK